MARQARTVSSPGFQLPNTLQSKACSDQEIEPLAERLSKPRNPKLLQVGFDFRGSSTEEPLFKLPVEVPKIVPYLDSVGLPLLISKIPTGREAQA